MSELINDRTAYGRKICLMCGATGKDIKEENDISKPLYHFSYGQKPLYAKKNVCKKCGYEWA
jgi:ribosomal protein L40E